jgi:hypothetical protein
VENFLCIKLVTDQSSLFANEYEDGDILILQKVLTHNESDDEDEENNFRDPSFSEPLTSLENRSFHDLENFDAFDFVTPAAPTQFDTENGMNIDLSEHADIAERAEDETFLPYKSTEYKVFYGQL